MGKRMEYEYDYSALRGRIVEKCGSVKNYANALGSSIQTVSIKLRNLGRFTQDDILKSMEILELEDATPYFFKKKV